MFVVTDVVTVNQTTTVKFTLLQVGEVVVLASCQVVEWEHAGGWIQWVHTNPDFRRQGLGTQLIEYVLDFARKAGKKGLGLGVQRHNAAAIALYQKLGFVGCYVHGDDLIMTIHLPKVAAGGSFAEQEGGQVNG